MIWAAELLLADPGWNRKRMKTVARKGEEFTVRVRPTVPVHLIYSTVFVDDDDRLITVEDVYGRDAALAAALDRVAGGIR